MFAEKLFKYTLSLGATSGLAPGNAAMWEMGMAWVEDKETIDAFDPADVEALEARYAGAEKRGVFHWQMLIRVLTMNQLMAFCMKWQD